jgi:Fe-S-cluster containining protein
MRANKIDQPDSEIRCETCAACCCRLEVLLLTDTGVPEEFIHTDKWGGMTMARLGDGWCAALDRNSMLCTIYDQRPSICREFEMGGEDCLAERGCK